MVSRPILWMALPWSQLTLSNGVVFDQDISFNIHIK